MVNLEIPSRKNKINLLNSSSFSDGGAPIDAYEVEKYDVAQAKWVPIGKTTKPEFKVTGLEPGHQYKFRVKAINSEGPSEELVTDKPILAKNPYGVFQRPRDLAKINII
jgi:hypothetical protein